MESFWVVVGVFLIAILVAGGFAIGVIFGGVIWRQARNDANSDLVLFEPSSDPDADGDDDDDEYSGHRRGQWGR
jgi:hypothetical protein